MAPSSVLWPRPTPTGRSQNTAGPYRGPRQLAVTALRWPVPRGVLAGRLALLVRVRPVRGPPYRGARRLPPAVGHRSRVHHAVSEGFDEFGHHRLRRRGVP